MPIPIPGPSPEEASPVQAATLPSVARPYALREPQGWVVEQERQHHNQALYLLGEWVFFVLLWHETDFHAGLVTRCSTCFPAADSRESRIAAVYQQPRQNECPNCFGTSFEGGYRARIVRPAMITDVEENEKSDKRGMVHPGSVNVQTTVDFRCRNGDIIVRSDNSRWQVSAMQREQIRVGFEHASQTDQGIGLTMQANREEDLTVAYKLPPTSRTLVRAVLNQPMRFPGNFIDHEEMRGPLVVPGKID